jgi:hypothetical protein
MRQTFRDGRGISDDDRRINDAEDDLQMWLLARYLVRNAFSPVERSQLREGENLGVTLIICSNTGNVEDIRFRFMRQSGYATIPVSTWWRIELELKREIRLTPSAHGRNMNFLYRGWGMDVARMIREQGVSAPPPGGGNPGGPMGIEDDCPIGGGIGPLRATDPLEETKILEENEALE